MGIFWRAAGKGEFWKNPFRALPIEIYPFSRTRMYSPTNWPTPVPKMDRARPVTFWLARRVMVRKLKIREARAPARKAQRMPMPTATKPLAPAPAAFS